jgi:lysophospholipase L1-like esterase
MATSTRMRGALLATVAAGTVAVGAAPAAAAGSAGYVALGDSYTSAPLVLPVAPGSALECGQSAVNYPHLTAQALGLALTDVSCGGATVQDMTQSQFPGVAPQFAALSPSTKIVTVGIGGNDNNTFATALVGCASIDLAQPGNPGAPCESVYGSTFANNIASDAPNIAAAIRQIHRLSPQAAVFVVGYPDILPQQGSCYPQVPLTAGDVAYLNGVEQDLNGMLATQAGANGATFVDTYGPSIGHDACQAEGTRWVEPPVPGTDSAPVHPNAAGESAMATLIEAAIG